tara:strand:+ start:861 stop:1913 length:1053 start_codon:yes stop_codon:yes gene_type:complete
MANFQINTITGKDSKSGTSFVGVTTVSSTGSMRIPSGPTEHRGGRGRGVFGGGESNAMDFIEIATTGNATDFGDLSETERLRPYSFASSTRGIFGGGRDHPNYWSSIDYITISSGGGSNDFGELVQGGWSGAGASSNTRGLFFGGYYPGTTDFAGTVRNFKKIQFVEIASTGVNASVFGELTENGIRENGALASPTRAVRLGGKTTTTAPSWSNEVKSIDYITIATKGDAQDFGELIEKNAAGTACSNSTRGIHAGGVFPAPSRINVIQYITIASLGNAQDFGDLTSANCLQGGAASSTRGVFAGGSQPTTVNTIEFITIATTGNATDFGDRTEVKSGLGGFSDVHGGLG